MPKILYEWYQHIFPKPNRTRYQFQQRQAKLHSAATAIRQLRFHLQRSVSTRANCENETNNQPSDA